MLNWAMGRGVALAFGPKLCFIPHTFTSKLKLSRRLACIGHAMAARLTLNFRTKQNAQNED